MDPNAQTPAAESQPEFTQAQVDAATTTARAEGNAAGVKAEQERFAALAELDGGSKVSAELTAALAAGTSVADFALAQARGHKAKLGAAATAAKTDAVAGTDLPEGGATATPGKQAKVNRGQAYAESKAARAKA